MILNESDPEFYSCYGTEYEQLINIYLNKFAKSKLENIIEENKKDISIKCEQYIDSNLKKAVGSECKKIVDYEFNNRVKPLGIKIGYKSPNKRDIKEDINNYLNRHHYICPICHSDKWMTDAKVYSISTIEKYEIPFNIDNSKIPSQLNVNPVVPVNCEKCGYTIFFNPKLFVKRK